MCGLAAAFAYHPEARLSSEVWLRQTCTALAPRGPDGEGMWSDADDRVALGHRRLAILDLTSDGAQPMADGEADPLAPRIVFNGEIYNFRALRAELEATGEHFRSNSDTEVLLRLYRREGASFVRRLRGMYAFALYDPARRGMLLARDPYGVKPLYVADDGRTFRAASQVKALLAGGGIDTTPDPAGHVGFWMWGHVPAPYTLFAGIRSFPAGHTQWIDAQGPRAPVEFDALRSMLEPHPSEAAPSVRDALLDSVRHHLVSDVEVGVFLSSGRDSAALVGLATELQGRVRTVTLGFREFVGTPYDEVPIAESIARYYGTEHTTVWVTEADFREAREHLLHAMDQPTVDGVNTYFVSRAAAQAGLKVVLSGLGGDELFGGYRSFRRVPRTVRALRMVPRPFGRAMRRVLAPLLHGRAPSKLAGVLEYGGTYGGAYLLERSMTMPWNLDVHLDPDTIREGLVRLDTEARLAHTIEGLRSSQARLTALESAWYMRHQLLRDSDWASMAHSLELRVPFVDPVLTRSLAGRIDHPGALTKDALARSARPLLPEDVLNRPKTGFFIPVYTWMGQGEGGTSHGLRDWAAFVYDNVYRI